MQHQLLEQSDATCFLVEAIAKHSQNIEWVASVDGVRCQHPQIRRVSMDVFYEIVFWVKDAFYRLCNALPIILDDVIEETHTGTIDNTVYEELRSISSDTVRSLYLLAFSTYEGFNTIK